MSSGEKHESSGYCQLCGGHGQLSSGMTAPFQCYSCGGTGRESRSQVDPDHFDPAKAGEYRLIRGDLWRDLVGYFGPHADCDEGDCDLGRRAAALARLVMQEERRHG